jgi:hypothetical protein
MTLSHLRLVSLRDTMTSETAFTTRLAYRPVIFSKRSG